uniref:Protein kinase domain-containing protein n=1 Tax=Octactis speculum TaxID=3111310 RepID=A0A7S2ASP4_9STRA|mmetsp:Transcript_14861/g.19860  ORF Transcript_14861/g.19860 Transcript_14861/m.19860 type:complete len:416 (+) Transcript_14861:28-1275(+)
MRRRTASEPIPFTPPQIFPGNLFSGCYVFDQSQQLVCNDGLVLQGEKGFYWLYRTLRNCQFGKVKHAFRVTFDNVQNGFHMTGEEFAVKRLEKARCENRASTTCDDPMAEVSAIQFVQNNRTATDPPLRILELLECVNDRAVPDECYNLVLPYCEGGELLEVINNEPTYHLAESVARGAFRHILGTLVHLQRLNLCHRDLSPENVLLRPTTAQRRGGENSTSSFPEEDTLTGPLAGFECVIIDFGMACRLAVDAAGAEDAAHGFPCMLPPYGQRGKLSYMPPEVFTGLCYIEGFAVDLWAAAVILFTMLLGKLPYRIPSPQLCPAFALISSGRLHDHVYGLQSRQETYAAPSRAVLDLLQQMLSLDPSQRLTLSEVMVHPWVMMVDVDQSPTNEDEMTEHTLVDSMEGLMNEDPY